MRSGPLEGAEVQFFLGPERGLGLSPCAQGTEVHLDAPSIDRSSRGAPRPPWQRARPPEGPARRRHGVSHVRYGAVHRSARARRMSGARSEVGAHRFPGPAPRRQTLRRFTRRTLGLAIQRLGTSSTRAARRGRCARRPAAVRPDLRRRPRRPPAKSVGVVLRLSRLWPTPGDGSFSLAVGGTDGSKASLYVCPGADESRDWTDRVPRPPRSRQRPGASMVGRSFGKSERTRAGSSKRISKVIRSWRRLVAPSFVWMSIFGLELPALDTDNARVFSDISFTIELADNTKVKIAVSPSSGKRSPRRRPASHWTGQSSLMSAGTVRSTLTRLGRQHCPAG